MQIILKLLLRKDKTLIICHNIDELYAEIKMRQREEVEKCLKLLAESFDVLKPVIATFEKKMQFFTGI